MLEFSVLPLYLFDLLACGVPDGIPGEPLLPRFYEVLRPGIIGPRLDPFSAAEISYWYLTPEPLKYNTYLFLRGILAPGCYPDLLHEASGFMGSGLSNIRFIFDFLGHISSFLY